MEDIDRLVRMRELIKIVSMSRANIYLLMSKGRFSKNFKIGEQTAVWRLSAIEDWIKQRENEKNIYINPFACTYDNPYRMQ